MARIRTIKPEFWTSEQVMACSRDARLIFIGLWNFSDDGGVHPASLVRIKAQILPGDDCNIKDMQKWINELIDNDLIIEYTHDGKNYYKITGWKHQKIDQPTYKYPLPTGEIVPKIRRKVMGKKENSPNVHGTFIERSVNVHDGCIRDVDVEGNGREGKGEEGNGKTKTNTIVVGEKFAERLDCPHQDIINLYHKVLPMCKKVKAWTPKRKSHLQQRWREHEARQNLGWWEEFFKVVAASKFLTGNVPMPPGRDKPWQATLEWLIMPNNFVKVIEGNYEA
jgi:hypothetical protein